MDLCTPDLAVKSDTRSGEAHAIRCKRWSCPICHEINRKQVMAYARNGRPTAMLTLTVSSKNYPDPADAARDLKRGLVLLRRMIKRRWPSENLHFLAVFERHKSGYPHLHLLVRAGYLHQPILKAMWKSITGSIHVHIRKIGKSAKAASYVAKYIGKDLSAFTGCKRWWRSHSYNDLDHQGEKRPYDPRPWNRWMADIRKLRTAFAILGVEYEQTGPTSIVWRQTTGPPIAVGDAIRYANGLYPSVYDGGAK